MASKPQSWQSVFWREWRISEDADVTRRLFDRLLREPIGWLATLATIGAGMVCGAVAWMVLVLAVSTVRMQPAKAEWPRLWEGADVHLMIGALGGGTLAVAVCMYLWERLTRERWLRWVAWQPFDLARNSGDPRFGLFAYMGIIYGLCGLGMVGPTVGWGYGILFVAAMLALLFAEAKDDTHVFDFLRRAHSGTRGAFLGLIDGAIWGMAGGALVWLPFRISAGSDAAVAAGGAYALLGLLLFGPVHKAIALGLEKPAHARAAAIGFAEDSRPLLLWWSHRPHPYDLEDALREAGNGEWTEFLDRLDKWRAKPEAPSRLVGLLQSTNWSERLAARHALVTLGGEAVNDLQQLLKKNDPSAQRLAAWILRSIGADTAARFAKELDAHVCPKCLVRYHTHWVSLPAWLPVAYYGCRTCRQTREFFFAPAGSVAVLDRRMRKPAQHLSALYVNWHAERALFDFDRVEVRDADDSDVERFCIQVQNDGDELRQRRYKSVACVVWRHCGLSENTRRLLDATFGEAVESA